MNNQFSQRVSDIITYSKEEANRLKNRYIGPEHLLLGMLRDGGGKAIEILQKLNIDLNRVKKRIYNFQYVFYRFILFIYKTRATV